MTSATSGRSDATTTTEDLKGPLCIYYFPNGCGVISSEAPRVLSANFMSPTMNSTPDITPVYDLGATTVHRRPLALIPITLTPPNLSWLDSSSSNSVPFRKTLPPLGFSVAPPEDLYSEELWSVPPRLLPPLPPPRRRGVAKRRGTPRRKKLNRICDDENLQIVRALEPQEAVIHQQENLPDLITPPDPEPIILTPSSPVSSPSSSVLERDDDIIMRLTAAGASPGLMHRRYSMPETIMRKYRLAQLSSSTDDYMNTSAASRVSTASPKRSGCVLCGSASRDVRRSALLRRMIKSPQNNCSCVVRSLDSSATELRAPPSPKIAFQERDCSSENTYHSHIHTPSPRPTHTDLRIMPDKEIIQCDESLTFESPCYEVLEIIVSETVTSSNLDNSPAEKPPKDFDIDEYVSNILVESLHSLTEQIESGVGVSILEKEIKVRLQNAAVNTIVHLSPTSNNQIIFGNEELCNRRDSCNNLPTARIDEIMTQDEAVQVSERDRNNNNDTEKREDEKRGIIQQIQRLFEDDKKGTTLGAIGAGNYRHDVVPRYCALPHSSSMEVQISSSEGANSGAASLVDSLDEPRSPRDLLALLPDTPTQIQRKPTAFFIRMSDEECSCVTEDSVAGKLPETIRKRLIRRQKRREAKTRARRPKIERAANALLDDLLSEIILKIAHDEHQQMRIRNPPTELRGRLALRPTPPRRRYHKSEIREGGSRIEILEILEYADTTETRTSDEGRYKRKSKIPVPVQERIQKMRRPWEEVGGRVIDIIPEEKIVGVESPPRTVSRRICSTPPPRRSTATSPAPPIAPRPPRRPPGSKEVDVEDRKSASTQCEPPVEKVPLVNQTVQTEKYESPCKNKVVLKPEKKRVAKDTKTEKSILKTKTTNNVKESKAKKLKEVLTRPKPISRATSSSRNRSSSRESADSSSSGGLLCTKWVQRKRKPKTRPKPPPQNKGWSLTLSGGVGTQLPQNVDMRVKFPETTISHTNRMSHAIRPQDNSCGCHPALPSVSSARHNNKMILRNHSTDSSILASKSTKKSTDTLPEVETYRESRSQTKHSVKTRACCPLCWPRAASPRTATRPPPSASRFSDGLSVFGCGIIPRPRPRRVPSRLSVRCPHGFMDHQH